MGEIRTLGRCLLLCALISRYPEALAWARERLQSRWGQLAMVSPEFPFHETEFYTRTMGDQLLKQFVVFQPGCFDPSELARCKLESNQWEQEYADIGGLMGPYMLHPYHWAVIDRWFDPECPDWIVNTRLCHSFAAFGAPVLG